MSPCSQESGEDGSKGFPVPGMSHISDGSTVGVAWVCDLGCLGFLDFHHRVLSDHAVCFQLLVYRSYRHAKETELSSRCCG